MLKSVSLWVFGFTLFAVAVPQAQAAAVGLIVSTKGDVKVQRPAKKDWVKASVMLSLADGSQVKVGPNSQAVVVLYGNGARYEIAPGSVAQLSATACKNIAGPAPKAMSVLPIRQAQILKDSRVAGGRAASTVLRSGTNHLELQSLSNTAVLESRPTFRWRSVEGAAAYKVKLWDENDQQIWQGESATSTLSYPADAPALKPGIEYLWAVTTNVNDTRYKGEGVFRLLADEKSKEVKNELAPLQGAENDAVTGVTRAEIYASYSLWDDAIAAYQQLAQAFPDASNIHKALANLLAEQGRAEESRQHQKRTEALLAENGAP